MQTDKDALVLEQLHIDSYALLTLETPRIASAVKPGQFIMIRTSGLSQPLLRRPFSVHRRDRKANTISIFYQVVGQGTSLLSEKRVGERLDILGPLGRGFSLSPPTDGELALVGGGRGIAPFCFLAEELRGSGRDLNNLKIFYGGRSMRDLPLRERIEKNGYPLFCSTDDGSSGYHGLISELLSVHYKESRPVFVYGCGPDAMMEAVAGVARDWGIPSEFSLESHMGCGFGACWGCVQRIRKDNVEAWRKICEEGPVFPAEEIVWEKF